MLLLLVQFPIKGKLFQQVVLLLPPLPFSISELLHTKLSCEEETFLDKPREFIRLIEREPMSAKTTPIEVVGGEQEEEYEEEEEEDDDVDDDDEGEEEVE